MAHEESKPAGEAAKPKGEWKHPAAAFAGQAGRRFSLWFLPLGLLGPLIGSAIWMVFIVLMLWALKLANIIFQSAFISLLVNSVATNLQWFLVFSLVIGYIDFFARRFQPAGIWLFPVSNAVGATFSAWIVAWIFRAVGTLAGVQILFDMGALLRANLLVVFAVFLALGALMLESRRMFRGVWHG